MEKSTAQIDGIAERLRHYVELQDAQGELEGRLQSARRSPSAIRALIAQYGLGAETLRTKDQELRAAVDPGLLPRCIDALGRLHQKREWSALVPPDRLNRLRQALPPALRTAAEVDGPRFGIGLGHLYCMTLLRLLDGPGGSLGQDGDTAAISERLEQLRGKLAALRRSIQEMPGELGRDYLAREVLGRGAVLFYALTTATPEEHERFTRWTQAAHTVLTQERRGIPEVERIADEVRKTAGEAEDFSLDHCQRAAVAVFPELRRALWPGVELGRVDELLAWAASSTGRRELGVS